VAPAGTPREIILTLNKLINDYIESDIGKQHFEAADMQAAGGTPEDLKRFIASEVTKWGRSSNRQASPCKERRNEASPTCGTVSSNL
jgi:tripartite-type tricarboxylate transporter receptor subunit TctC